jgi:hypothetical protein
MSSNIRRVAAVLFALALGACAMNAQQPGPSQQPPVNGGASGQAGSGADPNFPGLVSPNNLKIQWNNYDKGNPQVIMPGQDHGATYLGWNDQGSWLVGADDGKIYVWNLRQNSLTMVFKNYKQIPQETIASLKNNPLAAAKGTPQNTGPKQTGPKPETPDTSRQAAFFGGSGIAAQGAVPGAITGSGAAIQNGMLTFTRADNTKASYRVVRPKVAQGVPGNTGAWIAMEDGGKGILFTVNADNSVTGREMPAQIIQALR